MNDTVRLTIERIDVTNIALPGDVLLDITETTETVLERAVAWITVRGHRGLLPSLQRTLSSPNEDGWCAVVNKPNSLAFLATWPWCRGPHDLLTLYGMRPEDRG